MKAKIYDHKKIESKWQKEWEKKRTYQTLNSSKEKKMYVLDMFPYPSGVGLHVGHPRGYIGSDVYARMKRMQGYNVLHPMGYDAFGLPAEQYALEHKIHPRKAVEENIKTFERQLSMIGLSYDWSRKVNTTDPKYYKWTQWIFLQIYNSWYDNTKGKARKINELVSIFEKGGNEKVNAACSNDTKIFNNKEWKAFSKKEKHDILMKYRLAFEGYSEVNWCPKLGTVLANDEIVNDTNGNPISERGGYPVEKKSMRQWFMRITAYADRLLTGLDSLEWSEHIKEIQKNWIGKSEGSEIEFKVKNPSPALPKGKGEKPGYYTTDPKMWKLLQPRVIEMRKNPTESEKRLWKVLRENLEYHFRRQHIINKFIVDFVCLSKNLVIEVDGDIHDLQKKEDEERTNILTMLGFKVIRFKNEEILKNINNVVNKINEALEVLPFGEDLGEVELESIKVFTTRADTLFGATYVVLAPEHELVRKLKKQITNWKEAETYINKVKNKTDEDRTKNDKEKTGVELKGVKAINPANGEEIPVWIADYVLVGYGTGAVMAVPAHDERDFEFAKKYNLPIKPVIVGVYGKDSVFTDDGILIDSEQFNNLTSEEARKKITEFVGGKMVTKFRMRDAIFARQRYWGEPIPLKHNSDGTITELKEKDLPLELPNVKSYESTGTGESPLAGVKSWVKEGYETNTMPGWAGSSWYFLRYMDPQNSKNFASKKAIDYWKNVDMYVGGQEHATGHLLYSRFWNNFLYDMGYVSSKEPFKKMKNQGMILATDGRKMSKRWGNVINPDDIVKNYGADTLRIYEMFMGPFEQSLPWSTESIIGSRRFIERVWRMGVRITSPQPSPKGREQFKVLPFGEDLGGVLGSSSEDIAIEKILHKTLKKVSEDIENFAFNTAISSMMIFMNEIEKFDKIGKNDFKMFLQMLAPFAPHITEELWGMLNHPSLTLPKGKGMKSKVLPFGEDLGGVKNSIHLSSWPKWDKKKLVEEEIKIVVQVNGKVRAEIMVRKDISEDDIKALALKEKRVIPWTENKQIKRVIYVPGRVVNIVI